MQLSALEECIGENGKQHKIEPISAKFRQNFLYILNLLPGEHAWNDTRSISRYCPFKTMSFSEKKSLQSN
jgi:hypothetical protein